MKTIVIALAWSFWAAFSIRAGSVDGWTAVAPREEIRPQFQHTESGGKSGHGALAIRADEREGLHGWWQKTFSVTAGLHYRFSAWRRAKNVAVPRRSVLARVLWRDEAGKEVQRREGVVTNYSRGVVASAEPEYPRESGAGIDGWVEMSGVYDGFFPEVARELSNRGAEIIAWPVWGCNPEQARARACENQVYLVSSTYEDVSRDWMLTAIYGQDGSVLVQAREWGTVCVAEVDLRNRPCAAGFCHGRCHQ